MNLFSVLTCSAISLDPRVGLSITRLLGSLGAAGATLTATHYFLGFLKSRENGRARIVEEFKDHHSESQRKFQDQLDRLFTRQQENQHDFQTQIGQMSESHNIILRDAIVAMSASRTALTDRRKPSMACRKALVRSA